MVALLKEDSLPSGSLPGRPSSERPVSGRTVSGRTVSGRTVSGRTVSGRTVSGRTVSGRTVSGRTQPMPQLAPRLRLVQTDQSPLRLDLETPANMADLIDLDGKLVRREAEPNLQTTQSEDLQPAITPAFAVITAVLILALLSFVRISQGAPPASSWDSLAPTPAVASAPGVGETVHIVDAGDTLWAIAGEIAPDLDRREAVDALAQRNGGSGVQAGQRLVIPQVLASS